MAVSTSASPLLPAVFVNHGAGPMPLMKSPDQADLLRSWRPGTKIHNLLNDPRVRCVIMVSAHHKSDRPGVVAVQSDGPAAAGRMLFDYGGFPPETYRYSLDNPGDAAVSDAVARAVEGAGFRVKRESGRGYDHGCFVPLLAIGVPARTPVVQVSLMAGYDAAAHAKLGAALAPLRAQGCLLVGSGMTFHNLPAFFKGGGAAHKKAAEFDAALQAAVTAGRPLAEWERLPHARFAHPDEDHLVPLLVAAGSAQAGGRVEASTSEMSGFVSSQFIFYD
eukprot:Rhum_TRINITY_DN24927_c0_g1::Rhum_TRINITY_DN24927_c0_g1_i1::g.180630::m.180630